MSLLIANSAELDDFGTWALGHPEMGFQDTHVLDVDAYGNSESLVKEIRKISDHEIVYEMVLGSFYTEVSYLAELINVAEEYGSRIRLIENTPSVIKGKTAMIPWGPFQVLAVRQEPLNNVTHRAIKQLADIGITLIVIIFFYWWLYAIIAVLIKLSSQGSVIFKQRRIGKGGQPFDCYKFRSMRTPVIDSDNFRKITQNRDDRITWIGKLLRVTNLDELPQFINVLKGDMSVIGPRPHMVVEDEKISTLLVKYKIRRFVRPGITGWAAVNGYRGGTENMELMQERINHDIYYIENWTIWLDTKILFLTAWKMLTLSTDAQ
ncbi:MAG: sugar transferase [Candidatus Marinimicrobia bacterium]|nr:sugar transferase [Candidatus Neomarinimicrobiota bacterium]